MGEVHLIKPNTSEAVVKQVMIHCVLQCSCGCPEPLLLPFHPGPGHFSVTCPQCRTTYQLARMTLTQGNLQIGIGATMPRILAPSAAGGGVQ